MNYIAESGKITISQTVSNEREPLVKITVALPDRREIVIEVEPDAFALALTGRARQECQVQKREYVTSPKEITRVLLRDVMSARLTVDDHREIAAVVGVEYDRLPGLRPISKLTEIILHAERKSLTPAIIDWIERNRPAVYALLS